MLGSFEAQKRYFFQLNDFNIMDISEIFVSLNNVEIVATYIYITLNILFMFVIYNISFSYVTNNILRILFLLEIIILLSSFIFLIIGMHFGDIYGQIVVLHLLTIAAVEAAVGLALIYSYYRLWRTVKISALSKIKG